MASGEAGVPRAPKGSPGSPGRRSSGGTHRRSGVELAEALEEQGTSFRVSTGWDASMVSFTCTAERLPDTLALLAEVVREPSFPVDEVERLRQQRLAALAQRRADPSDLADDEADRVLYPLGHPWRRCILGTEASVAESLEPEQVARWSEAAHRCRAVAGWCLPATWSWTRRRPRWPGCWGLDGDPPLAPLPPRGPARSRAPGDDPTSPRRRADRAPDPAPRSGSGYGQYHELLVANAVLGGSFTSRLNLNLREKHGFTYGVRSGWTFRRGPGNSPSRRRWGPRSRWMRSGKPWRN
jgi:zinc protease